ncbi:hypothetical protein C8R43DRAFT_963561 [Mycena crocata]|nr:hypothetical protein C8R43DRAFT_963561 [Mycena crocata]
MCTNGVVNSRGIPRSQLSLRSFKPTTLLLVESGIADRYCRIRPRDSSAVNLKSMCNRSGWWKSLIEEEELVKVLKLREYLTIGEEKPQFFTHLCDLFDGLNVGSWDELVVGIKELDSGHLVSTLYEEKTFDTRQACGTSETRTYQAKVCYHMPSIFEEQRNPYQWECVNFSGRGRINVVVLQRRLEMIKLTLVRIIVGLLDQGKVSHAGTDSSDLSPSADTRSLV